MLAAITAAIQGYSIIIQGIKTMLHVTLKSKSWDREVVVTSDCETFVSVGSWDHGIFYAGVVELENVDAELFSAFLISSMNKTGRLEAVTISAEYEESGVHYNFEARVSEHGSGYLVPWGRWDDNNERDGEKHELTYSELLEYMTEDLLTMSDDSLECYHAIYNTYCNIELYSLTIHNLAHGDKKSLMIERLQNYLIYIRHKVAIYTAKHKKAA